MANESEETRQVDATLFDPRKVAALGATALAALVVEHAEHDEELAHALTLRHAAAEGSVVLRGAISDAIDEIAADDRQLTNDDVHIIARRLEVIQRTIIDDLLRLEPVAAIALLGRLVRLDDQLLERISDDGWPIEDALDHVLHAYGEAWAALPDRDPRAVALEVLDLLASDAWGTRRDAVSAFATALGPGGLEKLEALASASGRELDTRKLRMHIADARGDVDSYIALHVEAGSVSQALLPICSRLVAANRLEAALGWLDSVPVDDHRLFDVERLRVDLLERLDRTVEAQSARWQAFERTLAVDLFEALARHLDDRDRAAALERAVEIARDHGDLLCALSFLRRMAPEAAAELVLENENRLSGGTYWILRPVAEAVGTVDPLAAIVIYRRLVDAVLEKGRAKDYRLAVRDLQAATRMATRVSAWRGRSTHAVYLGQLRAMHARKRSFWSLATAAGLG